ncbi:MAG: 4Fe-4S binding protein [Methanothermobacter sp.]|uniref:4Fe-4S binding protein n=1 Tax=Methanothermobacter sp. TaxID=1884223 RepID=UPI003C787406
MPSFDFSRCSMCGKCSEVCRKNAIVVVDGRRPIFIRDRCNGCGTCILSCRNNAIKEEETITGFLYDGELPENYDEKIRRNFRLFSGETTVNIESSARVVDSLMKKAREHREMDFVIIDTAAGLHCNVIHALMGVHLAFAVTEPTPFGSHDLRRILELLDRLGVDSNIILNRAGTGKADLVLDVSRETGKPIVAEIDYSKEIMAAYSSGKPFKVPGIDTVAELLEMQRC